MLPKLYRTSHPRAPHLVIFTDPQGKQVRRNFKDEEKAKAYHRELLAKAKVVGTVGLVMDQEMRADYFAARRALDGVPLMTERDLEIAHLDRNALHLKTGERIFIVAHRRPPEPKPVPPAAVASQEAEEQSAAKSTLPAPPAEPVTWQTYSDGVTRPVSTSDGPGR